MQMEIFPFVMRWLDINYQNSGYLFTLRLSVGIVLVFRFLCCWRLMYVFIFVVQFR